MEDEVKKRELKLSEKCDLEAKLEKATIVIESQKVCTLATPKWDMPPWKADHESMGWQIKPGPTVAVRASRGAIVARAMACARASGRPLTLTP